MERLTKRDVNSVAYIEHGYCEAAANMQAIQRLAAYEDAEEQGWLVVLPCKVGEACYAICQLNCEYADCPRRDMRGDCDNKCPDVIVEVKTESVLLADLIGVPLYSTREAAEAALAANNDSTGG